MSEQTDDNTDDNTDHESDGQGMSTDTNTHVDASSSAGDINAEFGAGNAELDGNNISHEATRSDGTELAAVVVPEPDPVEAKRAIESILIVADQPVETQLLAQVLELPPGRVDDLCFELAGSYEADARGFVLTRVAGGYRLQSHPDMASYVERFVLDGQASRLSQAALETLAIVAYKQPISRAQVAQIRGVNVDGVIRTLTQRGYVAEIGQDPGPGQASLFGTTKMFLESIGLDALADLPPLGDFVPSAEVMEALEASLRFGGGDAAITPLITGDRGVGDEGEAGHTIVLDDDGGQHS